MVEYVLFSPVGGTDPISNLRDGALLHICRYYRPACVVLFLSKEMLAYQRKDDRYRRAVEQLAQEVGFPVQIDCVGRPDLEDVHLFDVYYQDFEDQLHGLHRAYPKHRVIANLSSGTPAMKGALSVLTTLMDFPVLGVQVSSPKKSHNGRREELNEFDFDLYWECNLDRNPEEAVNRCQELQSENLRAKLQRQALEAHLDAYDYQAAWAAGQQMRDFLSAEAGVLLDAACRRAHQEWRRIQPDVRERIIPKLDGGEAREIFEYLLWLQIRQQQGELADFLRGLTPVLFHLCVRAVQVQARFPIRDYCDRDWLDPEQLRRDAEGSAVCDLLEAHYRQPLRAGYLNSDLCCGILEGRIPGHPCVQPLTQLRAIESKARNLAAHTIIPVTDRLLRQECNCTSEKVMALLRQAAQVVLGRDQLQWNSYDLMNRRIKMALNL